MSSDPFANPADFLAFLRAAPETEFDCGGTFTCAATEFVREFTGKPRAYVVVADWSEDTHSGIIHPVPSWVNKAWSEPDDRFMSTYGAAADRIEAYLEAYHV